MTFNIELDLNNSNNWELVFEQSYQAETVAIGGKQKYLPISTITIPNVITSNYINCQFEVNYKMETWDSAGFISPLANINVPELNEKISLGNTFVYLNKGNLITLPLGDNEAYTLDYHPPEWFRDVTVKIYKYIGIIKDDYIDLLNKAIDDINKLL